MNAFVRQNLVNLNAAEGKRILDVWSEKLNGKDRIILRLEEDPDYEYLLSKKQIRKLLSAAIRDWCIIAITKYSAR